MLLSPFFFCLLLWGLFRILILKDPPTKSICNPLRLAHHRLINIHTTTLFINMSFCNLISQDPPTFNVLYHVIYSWFIDSVFQERTCSWIEYFQFANDDETWLLLDDMFPKEYHKVNRYITIKKREAFNVSRIWGHPANHINLKLVHLIFLYHH